MCRAKIRESGNQGVERVGGIEVRLRVGRSRSKDRLVEILGDATREQKPTLSSWDSGSTSFCLAEHLLGGLTSPSQALLRAELSTQLNVALKTLSELDQEVLALRHFEELSNAETAQVLQLTEQAASEIGRAHV